MIARPIYALLSTDTQIDALTSGRIKPVRFEAGKEFPLIQYSTDEVRPIPCRAKTLDLFGTVEVGVLATEYLGLMTLIGHVRRVLDDFDGVSAGYSLLIERGVEGPDEEDLELSCYYKSIRFEVTASALAA